MHWDCHSLSSLSSLRNRRNLRIIVPSLPSFPSVQPKNYETNPTPWCRCGVLYVSARKRSGSRLSLQLITKRTHLSRATGEAAGPLRWENYKTNPTFMNRRFKIPDLRGGATEPRMDTHFRELKNYETNPCARRASSKFRVQSSN